MKSRAQTKTQTAKSVNFAATEAGQALAVVFALSLGAFMVFGIGFAHPEIIHNVAHDVRHALAFPCH